MSKGMSEADVAALVVEYLEALGADVYQEVACSGGYADIVAKVHAELWIIEVKTKLSLALIVQAMERRRAAHRVIIAGPYTRNTNDVGMLCEALGIGLWTVSPSKGTYSPPRISERVDSRRWNSRPMKLGSRLDPQHKTHAKAGTQSGGRWTPFRKTAEEIARVVAASPGLPIREAVSRITHHYSTPHSARSSIAKWIESGSIAGVTAKRDGALIRLWPVEISKC